MYIQFIQDLEILSSTIIIFFSTIWDYLLRDIWSLLTENSDGFIERILDSLGFIGLEALLSNITLGGLLFSVSIVGLIILKFYL